MQSRGQTLGPVARLSAARGACLLAGKEELEDTHVRVDTAGWERVVVGGVSLCCMGMKFLRRPEPPALVGKGNSPLGSH